ncbi:CFI-box-CTERM domain-containing protein [Bdellovibrionota bacterium FG-1]
MSTPSSKVKTDREQGKLSRARKNAELQAEYAEKAQRLALLRRRIFLAQSGVHAFQQNQIPLAVKSFLAYLRILEDWKGVGEGKLTPALFDPKLDVSELLLISGVYWDLARLYDRTKSPEKQNLFNIYLQKYILFSRGMRFEPVAAETLRKYIANDKCLHVAEFKAAYRAMGGKSTCFVATALMDVCDPETLVTLRSFRDEQLARSEPGRAFIRWYYRHGPRLADWTEVQRPVVRKVLGFGLDVIAQRLQKLV